MDIDKEFEAAWPAIHKRGLDHGWKGIAKAAWRAALASQDTAPPAAVPAPGHAPALRTLMDKLGLKENDDLHDVLTAANLRIQRLAAAPAQANAWEEAVKDACTVAGELGWNEADPRASLNKLIEWHIQVALDPRVSDRAPAQAVDALEAAETIIWDAQKILAAYLPPDGVDEKKTIHALLELLDGPRCRAALAAQPAAPAGEPVADFYNKLAASQVSESDGIPADKLWDLYEGDAAPVANAGQAQGRIVSHEDMGAMGSRTVTAYPIGQAQAVAVPDGTWQLVPLLPTEEMEVAFAEVWFSRSRPIDDVDMADAYAAMLAAAPLPQQVAQTEDQPHDYIPRRARKVGGSYQADGTIIADFITLTTGARRFVFEFDNPAGMLHIFGPEQVEIGEPS